MATQKLSEFIESLNYNLQKYGDGIVYKLDEDGLQEEVNVIRTHTSEYKWNEEKEDIEEINVKNFFEIY